MQVSVAHGFTRHIGRAGQRVSGRAPTTVSESSVTAPATVLLIDDDPAIISSVVASLGEAGHQALVAMDSSEARTLVQRRSVTVVLFSWRFIAQQGPRFPARASPAQPYATCR